MHYLLLLGVFCTETDLLTYNHAAIHVNFDDVICPVKEPTFLRHFRCCHSCLYVHCTV